MELLSCWPEQRGQDELRKGGRAMPGGGGGALFMFYTLRFSDKTDSSLSPEEPPMILTSDY